MHFRQFDLNLLRVFEALFEEQNATLAGRRLGLSPSAVSHATARLREAVGDPLFVRIPGRMVPTQRAIELAPSILDILRQLQDVLENKTFVPTESRREFVVATVSYVSLVVIPPLLRVLQAQAPHVRLRTVPITDHSMRDLQNGDIDAVLVRTRGQHDAVECHVLFEETLVWVVRADHPAIQDGLTHERLRTIPFARISTPDLWTQQMGERSGSAYVDLVQSERQGCGSEPACDPAVIVPDSLSALMLVLESGFAALVPRRIATRTVLGHQLRTLDTSHTSPAAQIGAYVAARSRQDAGVDWLLARVREATTDIASLKA
ncbi:LysR family transcriptional regulator [Aureimonas sp. N4]|uniref:LysR family transcriptional regulator n=1 Tax=Aureimonas sp. N4 TaxID=1638165 RepID=UPI0007859214|nr:LysR family transcriptional regulator [Aureimonas sp. N4]